MGRSDESTQRYANNASSDKIGLHVGQSRLDDDARKALILISETLHRIDYRTAAMERRLREQEEWTEMQKGVVTRVGWLVGMAVLCGVGTALMWAYDAARGLRP